MYRKTPCKRLFKYLSVSDELEYTVAVDNAIETGANRASIPFVEVPAIEEEKPKKTRTQEIKEGLNGKKMAAQAPPVAPESVANGNDSTPPKNGTTASTPPRAATKEQLAEIRQLIAAIDYPEAALLDDYKVSALEELTSEIAAEIIRKLKA
jgi:hypothetical protein